MSDIPTSVPPPGPHGLAGRDDPAGGGSCRSPATRWAATRPRCAPRPWTVPARHLPEGFLTGAVLGALQAWAMGNARPRPVAWILATAVVLMVGVAVGA